jgi:hypothetical protein
MAVVSDNGIVRMGSAAFGADVRLSQIGLHK